MNDLKQFAEIMKSMKAYIDCVTDEAYQKGFEAGQHEATTLEYQCGLDDAWKTAKYLFSEMSNTEINLVFPQEWNNGGFKALMALHPQDAINRIKAYEEQQKADEIKVGDIITDGKINYLVIDITDKSYVALQGTDFEPAYIGKDYIKTYHNLHDSKDMGKIVEEINKAIKGEQRDCHTCKHQVVSSIECVDCRGFGKWEPKEVTE